MDRQCSNLHSKVGNSFVDSHFAGTGQVQHYVQNRTRSCAEQCDCPSHRFQRPRLCCYRHLRHGMRGDVGELQCRSQWVAGWEPFRCIPVGQCVGAQRLECDPQCCLWCDSGHIGIVFEAARIGHSHGSECTPLKHPDSYFLLLQAEPKGLSQTAILLFTYSSPEFPLPASFSDVMASETGGNDREFWPTVPVCPSLYIYSKIFQNVCNSLFLFFYASSTEG
jgi:hypothetical protein